jgi:hypothetical protein
MTTSSDVRSCTASSPKPTSAWAGRSPPSRSRHPRPDVVLRRRRGRGSLALSPASGGRRTWRQGPQRAGGDGHEGRAGAGDARRAVSGGGAKGVLHRWSLLPGRPRRGTAHGARSTTRPSPGAALGPRGGRRREVDGEGHVPAGDGVHLGAGAPGLLDGPAQRADAHGRALHSHDDLRPGLRCHAGLLGVPVRRGCGPCRTSTRDVGPAPASCEPPIASGSPRHSRQGRSPVAPVAAPETMTSSPRQEVQPWTRSVAAWAVSARASAPDRRS